MAEYLLYRGSGILPNIPCECMGDSIYLQISPEKRFSGLTPERLCDELARNEVVIDEVVDSITTLPAPRTPNGRHDLLDMPVSTNLLVQFIMAYRNDKRVFKRNPNGILSASILQ